MRVHGIELDGHRFEADMRRFEDEMARTPPAPGGIVFAGSSSFTLWTTLADDLAPLPVINRGFGGSITAEVLRYAPRVVLPCRPRTIVTYVGSNDLALGVTPHEVLADFRALVALVHRELPGTRVIFLPVRPSLARRAMLAAECVINAGLIAIADGDPLVGFIDAGERLVDGDGEPRGDLLADDRLHLCRRGYVEGWIPAIKPALLALERTGALPRPTPAPRLRYALAVEGAAELGTPTRLRLAVPNPGPGPLRFRGAWRPLAGVVATPPAVDSAIPALATQHLCFTLTVPAAAAGPVVFDWTADDVDATVSGHCPVTVRTAPAHYLRDGRPPTDAARLRAAFSFQARPAAGKWGGPADCSAGAWVRRETDGLRVRVEVTDDVLVPTGPQPWVRDSVELFLDLRPANVRTPGRTAGAFQLIAVPDLGGADGGTLHHYLTPLTGEIPGATLRSGRQAAGSGYWVEVWLPVAGLRAAGLGEPGETIAFDYYVNDADAPGVVKSRLVYSGPAATLGDPTTWTPLTPLA